ncbi:hypothetical protein [Zooshikella harenae]|uniref:DUF4105 domain-containing protein n=1 Tax=Zooshikella harenae TaxID=2827238 RepID=A0ABS5ZJC0_9GAMM|nr:hypothetical protein [Zooshikella harenae]MBU2713983.1 hypothetical protein [Zooshikella harenae]
MKYLYLVIILFYSQTIIAENIFIVSGENWGFIFNSPKLETHRDGISETGYQFQASSREGFIVSGFVEPALGKGRSPEECKSFYWSKALRNPNILRDTITTVKGGHFSIVNYLVDVEYKAKRYIQANTNYYGFREGKCIDVHVSQIFPFSKDIDFSNLLEFGKTFRYYR